MNKPTNTKSIPSQALSNLATSRVINNERHVRLILDVLCVKKINFKLVFTTGDVVFTVAQSDGRTLQAIIDMTSYPA